MGYSTLNSWGVEIWIRLHAQHQQPAAVARLSVIEHRAGVELPELGEDDDAVRSSLLDGDGAIGERLDVVIGDGQLTGVRSHRRKLHLATGDMCALLSAIDRNQADSFVGHKLVVVEMSAPFERSRRCR